DSDPLCKRVNQGGREICLIYVADVAITQTGSLTVTGGRPLALVSSAKMQIDGAIDGSSHGAQIGPAGRGTSRKVAGNPPPELGGGGGGAGGTFTLAGGNGGNGDKDNSIGMDGVGTGGTHGQAASAMALRGGCRGQKGGDERPGGGSGGGGGHSGGAL